MSVLKEKGNNICGERVKAAIKAAGITQAYLAEKLDITENAVSMIVNGKRSLSPKRATQISAITGWSAEYLLGISDFKNTSDEIVYHIGRLSDTNKALQFLINRAAEKNGISIVQYINDGGAEGEDRIFISVREATGRGEELLYTEDSLSSEILHFIDYQVGKIASQAFKCKQSKRNTGI